MTNKVRQTISEQYEKYILLYFQIIVSVINPYLFDFCRIIFKQQKLETKNL